MSDYWSEISQRIDAYLSNNNLAVSSTMSPGGEEKRCVVKSLKPTKFNTQEKYEKGVRRLKREVDAMQLFVGDYFPVLVDFDLDVPVISMEFIDLVTLDSFYGGFGQVKFTPRPAATAWILFDHLLSALDIVHAGGVVHRDIKPNNIMVARDGSRLVLIDFGLAAPVSAAPAPAAESDEDLITETIEGFSNGMLLLPEFAGTQGMSDKKRMIVSDVTLAVGVLGYMRAGLRRCLTFTEARKVISESASQLTIRELALFGETFQENFTERPQTVADVREFVQQGDTHFLERIASQGAQTYEAPRMSLVGINLSKNIAKMLRDTFGSKTKMTNRDENDGADFFDWGGHFEFRLFNKVLTARFVTGETARVFKADDARGLQEWFDEIAKTLPTT